MRSREISCPVCTADIPLAGDERKGDEIFCTFCGAPFRLTKAPARDDEDWGLEEDF
jgi:hypothetical protein